VSATATRTRTISWEDPRAVAAAGAEMEGIEYMRAAPVRRAEPRERVTRGVAPEVNVAETPVYAGLRDVHRDTSTKGAASVTKCARADPLIASFC
jgi:hypothetical protein